MAILALLAFVVSIAASVYVLLPKRELIFSQSGPGLYEGLYAERADLAEVHRRLAYDLFRFWESNDKKVRPLIRAFTLAATALVVEIVLLVALVSGSLV